jgi:hypothetical protein
VYVLDHFAQLGWQIGQKSWPLFLDRQHLASFVSRQLAVLVTLRNLNSFEEVPDISLVDCPQLRLDPPALLGDQILCLAREILNALPNLRATLKPTGIAISIIIIARFPASLTVGLGARLQQCPQPRISQNIKLYPLPPQVVQKVPKARAYQFFVKDDSTVILVGSSDRRAADVIKKKSSD